MLEKIVFKKDNNMPDVRCVNNLPELTRFFCSNITHVDLHISDVWEMAFRFVDERIVITKKQYIIKQNQGWLCSILKSFKDKLRTY